LRKSEGSSSMPHNASVILSGLRDRPSHQGKQLVFETSPCGMNAIFLTRSANALSCRFQHRLDYFWHKAATLIGGLVAYPHDAREPGSDRRLISGGLFNRAPKKDFRASGLRTVQRNAMRVWDRTGVQKLVKADSNISAQLSMEGSTKSFRWNTNLRNVDGDLERVF